ENGGVDGGWGGGSGWGGVRLRHVPGFGVAVHLNGCGDVRRGWPPGVDPPLEKLQKEGESGRKKINEYTRYATVLICFVQALMWVQYVMRPQNENGLGLAVEPYNGFWYMLTAVTIMTAGTIFMMWLGRRSDRKGN